MKFSRAKLLFGLIAVMLCFFVITFFQKWDTTVAQKNTEDFSPVVKSLKTNYLQAIKQCPVIIKKLEKGLSEFEKNKVESQILKSNKLIADCQMASRQYDAAAQSYKKLSVVEPQVARWHALIAENLVNAKKFGEALPISHLAVQLEPTNFSYRLLEARILAKLKLINRAVKAYREAIKVAPYNDFVALQEELNQLIAQPEVRR
jgi:Flp pilus assembly protein TadD